MIETNIRIVAPGATLYVWTRRATVVGADLSADLIERACGRLRYQHGIAAIPVGGDEPALLVATSTPIPHIRLADEEWELEVQDAGEPSKKIIFTDAGGPELLSLLIERAFFAQLARSSQYWSFDSPRIWYEAKPFLCQDGIQVYRRYEIGALPINDVGIGIAVDVGTAFFSKDTLAYFFDPTVPSQERRRRKERFDALTSRQAGQKGTLLYNRGEARSKCYFEQAPGDVTCATTGSIRIKGQTYTSLADYYQKVSPNLAFAEDGPAVRVSFANLDRPVWVAAERLVVRVMNDELPGRLQSVDKITPEQRRQLLQTFWSGVGLRPLGRVAPGVRAEFWRPADEHVHMLTLPELLFGQSQKLVSPPHRSIEAYKTHYRQRAEYLSKFGCYDVPPTMSRLVYVAVPNTFAEPVGTRLAQDLVDFVARWTRCPVNYQLVQYDSLSDAVEKLRAADRSGMAVVVLNDEPTAYHDVAYNLDRWRVKRITEQTLQSTWKQLTEGAWNNRINAYDLQRGKRRWRDFVEKSALDVLQLMDVVPYRYAQTNPYEAMLVIDVGHDRRHFAMSLLISRDEEKAVNWQIVSNVYPKPDHQHEAINAKMLEDQMVRLFTEVLPHRAVPLASVLILRDGRFCGQEPDGVNRAIQLLRERGKITQDARVDAVDLRKDTSKPIRLWDISGQCAENPLEGVVVELNAKTVAVTATGAATLTQGTAEPYIVVTNGRCTDLVEAGAATFVAAQLNYSSPTVAQRLPLPLKRTDEELTARAAQEIKRLR